MRWRGRRKSTNVEDRRGARAGGLIAGGGLGAVLVVLLIAFLGGDPSQIPGSIGLDGTGGGGDYQPTPEEEERAEFIRVVLADTEEVWTDLFRQAGRTYQKPVLVYFSGQTRSACGFASAAVGPFYCPAEEKAYVDLRFFDELSRRFGAPGDFAQAYVIAHEIGHHVQNLLGRSDWVHGQRGRVSPEEYNRLSVRLELQADYYAGVWAHHAQRRWQILEEGDLEEALEAAKAIGDDRLQMESQGYVVPDSFTHGTSAQRAAWFRHGFRTGDVAGGDTFDPDVFASVDPR